MSDETIGTRILQNNYIHKLAKQWLSIIFKKHFLRRTVGVGEMIVVAGIYSHLTNNPCQSFFVIDSWSMPLIFAFLRRAMHTAGPWAKSLIFALFFEHTAEACIISCTPQDKINEGFGEMVREDSEQLDATWGETGGKAKERHHALSEHETQRTNAVKDLWTREPRVLIWSTPSIHLPNCVYQLLCITSNSSILARPHLRIVVRVWSIRRNPDFEARMSSTPTWTRSACTISEEHWKWKRWQNLCVTVSQSGKMKKSDSHAEHWIGRVKVLVLHTYLN